MKPRSLSVKQYEKVIELLKEVADLAPSAQAEAEASGSNIRSTPTYSQTQIKIRQAFELLGVDTPGVFATETASEQADTTEDSESGEG